MSANSISSPAACAHAVADAPPPIQIIDVPYSGWQDNIVRQTQSLFIATIACFLIAFTGLTFRSTIAGKIAVGVGVCEILVIFIFTVVTAVSHHQIRNRIRVLIDSTPTPDLELLLSRAAALSSNSSFISNILLASSILAKRGASGAVIRVRECASGLIAPAFAQPFEPIPLDADDPHFLSLTAGLTDEPAARSSSAPASTKTHPRQRRAKLLLMGLVSVAMAAAFLAGFYASLRSFALTGRFNFGLALFTVAFASAIIGIIRPGGALHAAWLVVPGGAIARSRLRFRRDYFNARQSLLVIVPLTTQQSDNSCIIRIVDAQRQCTRSVTPKELDFLLRAWLSPCLPPPLQELQGLIPNLRTNTVSAVD